MDQNKSLDYGGGGLFEGLKGGCSLSRTEHSDEKNR